MNPRLLCKTALNAAVAALSLAVTVAYAEATIGPADATFYTAPKPLPSGNHGELVSYRTASLDLGKTAPPVNGWNVLYQSIDSRTFTSLISGTVIVPQAPWKGTGPRPVILYAVGTHGLGIGCAPSRQFEKGSDYENSNIVAALKQGYAVLVTDYDGYLVGTKPTYISGKSQGHAVLDIFKAATSIPGAGITADAPAAIWGYSQGGHGAAWAAELAPTYAPELKVVGVAAGGVPSDLMVLAPTLNRNAGFAFLASAMVGLRNEYPNGVPLQLIASESGKVEFDKIASECIFKSLFEYINRDISEFTLGNTTLESLLEVQPAIDAITEQALGTNPMPMPMYLYHGRADEFIPLDQGWSLRKKYCEMGGNVTFDLYPSEHIVTQFQGATTALKWLGDRFAGKPEQGTCANTAEAPTPTANQGGGNLVVTLNQWPLTGNVGLKKLKQTVPLPAGAKLTADSDITAETLLGNLSIPNFKQKIKVVGLPISVGMKITPAGETSGKVSLDTEGVLHILAKAPINITISSVLGINFGECKTATPVDMPIVFDGPLSSLGDGTLTFKGEVAFPPIKGCAISGVLSALMSGTGQTFSFTVAPPAPVRY
jgi:hypothetical protein